MKILNQKGWTITELLIASLMSLVIAGAAMEVYLAQHKHMIDQEQISDMQHNIRASIQELSAKIRMAGYHVPLGVHPLEVHNTDPDTLVVIFDSDRAGDIAIDWPMPQPSAELRCDDDDLTPLHDGDWLFIYDPVADTGEFFLASSVQYGSGHIQHNTMSLSRCYPQGSLILLLNKFKYYIDNTTDPDHPCLMMQYDEYPPQIYADNIVDLQLRYVLSSGAIVDVPPLPEMVREVKICISARTDREDSNPTYGYRHRQFETSVRVRNLAIN